MAPSTRVIRRLQRALWTRGVHIGAYRWTYPARRQALLGGAECLFDVGANAGQYGLEMRAHGFAGALYSYEPVGSAFACLAARAEVDGNWSAQQLAVGAVAGTSTINVSETSTFSSLLPVTDATLKGFAPARCVQQESIVVRTLDELVVETVAPHQPYAIKMDVQGYEQRVIEGGETAIAGASAVEIELCPVELYEGQWLLPELLVAMGERGFVLALVDNIFPQPDGRSLAFNGLFVPA